MGSSQSAPQSLHRDDSLNNRRTSDADRNIINTRRKRSKAGAQLIFSITAITISAAYAAFKDMKELHHTNLAMVVAFFWMATFFATFILLVFDFIIWHDQDRQIIWQYKVVSFLTLIAGVLFIVADNLLLVLADGSYGFISFLELPEVIMLAVLAYSGMPNDPHRNVIHDDKYENTIQSASNHAVFTTAVAFCLHAPILYGYVKNPLFRGHHHPQTDLSMTFLALIFSLSCSTITSMPLVFHSPAKRVILITFVRGLQKATLAALAASAVVLGEKFIDGFVLLAFIPELSIMFVNQGVVFFQREATITGVQQNQEQTDDEEELAGIFVLIVTANSTLLAALQGMYNGNIEENYKFYIKAAIFFLVSSTLSSLRRIAVRFKPPNYGDQGRVIVEIVVGLIYPLLEILVVCSLILKIAIDLYKSL